MEEFGFWANQSNILCDHDLRQYGNTDPRLDKAAGLDEM
jgi:hypothetical protein